MADEILSEVAVLRYARSRCVHMCCVGGGIRPLAESHEALRRAFLKEREERQQYQSGWVTEGEENDALRTDNAALTERVRVLEEALAAERKAAKFNIGAWGRERAENVKLRAALQELVDLKKLKDRIEASEPQCWTVQAENAKRREADIQEYLRRKPAAWDAARAALQSPAPAAPQDAGQGGEGRVIHALIGGAFRTFCGAEVTGSIAYVSNCCDDRVNCPGCREVLDIPPEVVEATLFPTPPSPRPACPHGVDNEEVVYVEVGDRRWTALMCSRCGLWRNMPSDPPAASTPSECEHGLPHPAICNTCSERALYPKPSDSRGGEGAP